MAVGYRSVLTLNENDDAVRVANDQFRSWLAEMVRDPRKTLVEGDWTGPGTFRLGPESTLTVIEQNGDAGLSRLLLEYVETNQSGMWTTRLYAHSSPKSHRLKQVLWFESEGERPDGSSASPGTPRLVRNILGAINAHDGTVPILSEPQTVRSDGTDELMGYILDEHRDLSVVVAAPIPGVDIDKWAKAVSSLSRDAVGCASFFILTPEALSALNEQLGSTHAVPDGAVRTFVPEVVIGDRSDGRRHRVLTARTMSRGLGANLKFSNRLVQAVATAPRINLLEADFPAELTRTARVLQRGQIQVETIAAPQPEVAGPDFVAVDSTVSDRPPKWLQGLKELVFRVAGASSVDEASLAQLSERFEYQENALTTASSKAQRLQLERERLEDSAADLRRQLEAEQLERALSDAERREAEKKVRSLERWRAERSDRYTYIEDFDAESDSDPVSVSEIVERLTDEQGFEEIQKYVELTDPVRAIDRADEIDAVDPAGTYAASFWEFVLVLRDYMAECLEHSFSGNVHMYLKSPDTKGRKCPTQRHRPNESEAVQNNSKMRRERTFVVPTQFEASGRMFMTAHFAPTHRDQNAPRMYYAVDLTNTKKVYIGYIGVHLTNTLTN